MSNQALPQKSRDMLKNHLDRCQNLGLILDKFAPWGQDQRGNWDLVMSNTIRRQGQNQVQQLSGGEAKGLWLSTRREARQGESPSLFEVQRTDVELMHAHQQRWRKLIVDNQGDVAFTITTAERLIAGLGASHVLETALTLDRNTGLPYLPGSTVKGLARAWGLIEVAAQLNVKLDDKVMIEGKEKSLLNVVAEMLIQETDEKLEEILQPSKDAQTYINGFRFIFGTQENAGAICFLDAIYAGTNEPRYAADVMTPHYVNYYTENGGKPPAEDDNPNPVSFITVDAGNTFAFGLLPRQATFKNQQEWDLKRVVDTTAEWLVNGLSQMGVGSKTAAGYGFFNRRSFKWWTD